MRVRKRERKRERRRATTINSGWSSLALTLTSDSYDTPLDYASTLCSAVYYRVTIRGGKG